MKTIFVFLITHFEETEALGTVDVLRRAGLNVKTVSLTGESVVVGSHGIPVTADLLFEEVKLDDAELLVLPGGTTAFNDHEGVKKLFRDFYDTGNKVAAICASPMVLGGLGILQGRKATCYPGFEKYLTGAELHVDEPVVVDGTVISQWVTADENFAVTFHPELVQEWLKQFAEKYDTVGKTRTFTTADGRSAQVSGGTYGWEIDEESELTALLANIENGDTVSREPAYVEGKTAISHGASDWGTTYAEVDLTNQKMWYVRDGQILMSTDVVTGLPTRARQTPEGVYTILERMRNKTLRGALKPDGTYEYETPVDYWMRVTYSGVGFHDATWQRTFGGDVYTYRGSHGCINMSYSDAGQLYDLIQVGDPVVIHY